MTRRTAFRQADVTRAVRGAVKGGVAVAEVRVDRDGTIVVSCQREQDRSEARDAAEVVAERLREPKAWQR